MSERQDHEKVVAAARNDMARFDARQALERWLQNYLAPEATIPACEWCVVTKEARGWKVERGTIDSDQPYQTLYADARTPAPPVMEIRPPKPEPVKPRFQVPEPRKVGSHEWISDQMLSRIEAAFTKAMFAGLVPDDAGSLTAAKVADMHRRYGQFVQVPLHEPMVLSYSSGTDHRLDAFRYMTLNWGVPVQHSPRFIGVDLASGPDLSAVVELKKPPPETSVRNK